MHKYTNAWEGILFESIKSFAFGKQSLNPAIEFQLKGEGER